ncbi:unnamed protein product [Phytophthora lilii]|uniref:Unnamed protein product n=1 Tax=Phytophthora lilii TaxID=2077276 RepID=A0A9W6YJZ2_9STRA|nr:unnamed protein product [Phytophthora lilii]
MQVVKVVLGVAFALVAASATTATEITNGMETKSIHDEVLDTQATARELTDNPSTLEERGRRGGGGRGGGRRRAGGQFYGPYTSIGLMYPSDTPYLKEDMQKLFKKWVARKKAEAKKKAEKAMAAAEKAKAAAETRRLRA